MELVYLILILWIVIYPVDSAIQHLNNRGEVSNKKSDVKCSKNKQGSILGIWGVDASPQNAQLSPKKILLLLQFISNYIGKIIQTRQGQCTHCSISQNCLSMAPDGNSAHIHFKTFPGSMPPDPP